MADFCLPKRYTKVFRDAVEEGSLNPEELRNMSSEGRRGLFTKMFGEDNAREVNALFESKLLLKNQQAGLLQWIRSLDGLSEPVRSDLVSRVERLEKAFDPDEEHGVLQDLINKRFGITPTDEEAQKITELTQKAAEERDTPTANLSGVSNEYLQTSQELRRYINSLKPTTVFHSIGKDIATVARNFLLMNPSTPLKAAENTAVNYTMDLASRRLGMWSASGANPELVKQATQEAWDTFKQTGRNVAAMESLDDSSKLGESNLLNTQQTALAKGAVTGTMEKTARKAAQITNKIAIDLEHNIVFNKFYHKTFYDGINLGSTNLARTEGLTGDALKARAAEIFKDAARVEPETDIGQMIRHYGQEQAARITNTNDTIVGNLAIAVKEKLNNWVDGLGDILMPIAKIPSDLIANGIENAGPGLPLGVRDIIKGRAKIQSEDMFTKQEGMIQFANGMQRIMRTTGTIGGSIFFASMLSPQDFTHDNYGNTFVKIGNVWINTEYFSLISPALGGAMYAKQFAKPSDGIFSKFALYGAGMLSPLKHAPIVDDLNHLVSSLTSTHALAGITRYAEDFFSSRAVPAFVHNLFKDRPFNRLFFGAHGVETPSDIMRDKAQQKLEKAKEKLKFGMNAWGEKKEAA